jgi:hypothetical protein
MAAPKRVDSRALKRRFQKVVADLFIAGELRAGRDLG